MNVAQLRDALAAFPDDLTVTVHDSEILEPLVIIGVSSGVISKHDTRGVPDPDYPDDDYDYLNDYPEHLKLRAGQLTVLLESD